MHTDPEQEVMTLTCRPELIGDRPQFWMDLTVHHDHRDSWTHLEPIPKPGRCVLYRIYGERERLLYVGTTVHPRQRFTQHRRKHDWWTTVRRIELWITRDTVEHQQGDWRDHRLNQHTARAWESLCVTTQKPAHNKTARG